MLDKLGEDQVFSPLCEKTLEKSLTAKEMDAEVDYLYSLLERQDKYGPGYMSTTPEKLPPMETEILPSNLPILDIPWGEQVFEVPSCPWLTNIDNYCAMGELSNQWNPHEREKFLVAMERVLFDAPYLFKYHPPDDPSACFV